MEDARLEQLKCMNNKEEITRLINTINNEKLLKILAKYGCTEKRSKTGDDLVPVLLLYGYQGVAFFYIHSNTTIGQQKQSLNRFTFVVGQSLSFTASVSETWKTYEPLSRASRKGVKPAPPKYLSLNDNDTLENYGDSCLGGCYCLFLTEPTVSN